MESDVNHGQAAKDELLASADGVADKACKPKMFSMMVSNNSNSVLYSDYPRVIKPRAK